MKRIFIIATLCATLCAALCGAGKRENSKDIFARKLHTFNAIVKELHTNYVDTLDAADIMDKTIDALLYQIDPYTEYYPSDNQDEILSISQGKYAGIGAMISKRGDTVYISQPQWTSPARAAGLRAGDAILSIDGVSAVGKDIDVSDVSKRLRGQAGTEVRVVVRRPYSPDTALTVAITRADIVVDPMPYHAVDADGIGYIRLTTFNESSARRVREALQEMVATGRLKGLVIDLRSNGGGLLEGAVQIASNFVPKGTEILRTRGRDAVDEHIYKTVGRPLDTKLPLAILTDGNTASASEILAGSMQDLDRAVIIGERSYGKGLVQQPRPLPYDDLLKITTGRYYIPSGRLIQVLDYSHRNPDGSPARMPDSLTHEFKTRAGRTVRDGGGITPDVKMERPEGNRLLYNIVSGFWAFDFATRHAATHPAPTSADSAIVDSAMFAAFKASIDPARFKYDRQCETALKYLRDAAKAEGYMTDSVAAQFDVLAAMLRHDLNHDLDNNREAIVELLESEFADRYFSDADRVRRTLPTDSVLIRAKEILLSPEEYQRLLKP